MQGNDAQGPQSTNPPMPPEEMLAALLDAVTLLGQRLTVVERQLTIQDDEIAQLARRLKPEDAST